MGGADGVQGGDRLARAAPDLRKTGMVMRWYKNENNGWIHDSMLDVVPPDAK